VTWQIVGAYLAGVATTPILAAIVIRFIEYKLDYPEKHAEESSWPSP
jgi:hypothetical protein